MIEELLPHIHKITVPLPKNPLKSVNSYVLLSEKRNLVIDTAFNRPTCREFLRQAYSEIGLNPNRTDFFATHLHVDHNGLIATFAKPEAKRYMGKADALLFENRLHWHKMLQDSVLLGVSPEMLQFAKKNHPAQKYGPKQATRWDCVEAGDTLTVGEYTLTCLETPGHTWGHICLYEAKHGILFSGDHILGDITPNIQVWRLDDNPLQSYMESLDMIAGLRVERVLPGHGNVLENCVERIAALKRHHLDRCEEVLEILKPKPRNVVQTASRMSWKIRAKSWEQFPLMQQWFASLEAAAHLRYLASRGLVLQEMSQEGWMQYSSVPDADRSIGMDS